MSARTIIHGSQCASTVREDLCRALGYRPRDVVSVRVTKKAVVVTYIDDGALRGPVVHPLRDA